jgi:succinyl-CoA synthetase beta subunit
MLLLEHHGKSLLRQYGFTTPAGMLVDSAAGLGAVLKQLPDRVVLKAQIPSGRRGKSGGIHFAETMEDARRAFQILLGNTIAGHEVHEILVEESISCLRERYAAIAVAHNGLHLMFARTGGIEVEATTAADQTSWLSIPVDPLRGPDPARVRDGLHRLGYQPEFHAAYEDVAQRLFRMCIACDATLIEINPLVECGDGQLLALDARIMIDVDALERQPALAALLSSQQQNTVKMPRRELINIRRIVGGSVGLIGLGSGLNMAIMDWLADSGAGVGALVDVDSAIGADRTEQGFTQAFDDYDQDSAIRAILVNIITCGYRLDDIVPPLLSALARRGPSAKPTSLHLRGNGMARTPALLGKAGWANSSSLKAAIEQVAATAQAKTWL